MTRSNLAAILVVAMVVGIPRPALLAAQDKSDFSGRWTLNRELSEFPREIGFGVDWLPSGGSGPSSTSGGRGRRGSGGGGTGAFPARPQSEDDSKRVQQLTAEVRNPSAHLTIAETPGGVTITDEGDTRVRFASMAGRKCFSSTGCRLA
jgi:hypothetical protein